VGGGAAGIVAAWRAAHCGARVVLFEKTPRLGTKVLISGGGKCNIAHDGPLEELLARFRPNERLFLRPSCYRFDNRQIMAMVANQGLELYTRADGRVFPSNGDAKDVVAILTGYLEGIDVFTNSPVVGISSDLILTVQAQAELKQTAKAAKHGFGATHLLAHALNVELEAQSWPGPSQVKAKAVVLAAGGSSYPKSGTTGDAWAWLRGLGHTIVKPCAALAPIYLQEPDVDLAGVAAREIGLKARAAKGVVASAVGDLLFTHQGVSGPTALDISREVAANLPEPVSLELDLFPYQKLDEIRPKVAALVESLPPRIPAALVQRLLGELQIQGSGLGRIDQKTRNRLADTVKAWRIGVVRTVPLEKGEVVAGGVSLDEVDPQTMASRKVEGLYLCGELLDVAGPVGGYNLQAAFATGYVAGESAAKASVKALS